MSQRRWTCRNPQCPVPHGAILGTVKGEATLNVTPDVRRVRIHLDTRHVVVTCPWCGTDRIYRDGSVYLERMVE